MIIIIGASQLHTIVGGTLVDDFTAYYANRHARERQGHRFYIQLSVPNGNFNELLGVYLILRDRGLLPDRLVVGVVYDDLGEAGVRPRIRDSLPEISQELEERFGPGISNLLTEKIKADRGTPGSAPGQTRPNILSGSPQDSLENFLIGSVENTWPPYASRHNVRSSISYFSYCLVEDFFNWLRKYKGYKPAPPISPHLRKWNLDALESLLKIAKADGVPLLFYKAPHPQMENFDFYPRGEFDGFFSWLAQCCARQGFDYVDLESLVPRHYWLNKGTVDFFHFQEEGHKILGAALDQAVAEIGKKRADAVQ